MATIGISPSPVRIRVDAISTSNLTLSGPQTADAVSLTDGMLCGALGQSDNKNGVYLVQDGAWLPVNPGFGTGLEVYATGGSANVNAVYGCDTTGAITWGTTTTTFTLKSSGAGAVTGTVVTATTKVVTQAIDTTTGGLTVTSAAPDSSSAYVMRLVATQDLASAGSTLLYLSNHSSLFNGLGIGAPSLGQADALCYTESLVASGTITAGQVVVWSGSKAVAAAAASAGLTTIAGVAIFGATNGTRLDVARSGRCYVNADAGIAAGTLLRTSGSVAGNVVDGAAIAGGIVGRACEATSGTVSGKVLVDLVLG